MVYLDSSALVKLVVVEAESAALRSFLQGHPNRASCGLARVEVLRAVSARGGLMIEGARRVVGRLDLVALDDALLDAAGELGASNLRSLDAIHLTAARRLGEDLECVVTYDHRMAAVAAMLGMPVASPA